jgi:hypothetical protein
MSDQTTNQLRGYKVTDSNMQCKGHQYELNKEFVHGGAIKHCVSGFHFCINAADCFEYYSFNKENRVFEVDGYGTVITEGNKTVCSHIKFLRELTWQEVLVVVNTGSDNTGLRNSGDRNSGDRNSGNLNSGNLNSGYSNSGYRNSGDSNSGNLNSGYSNSGDRNSGDRNSGYSNSGNLNSGDSNSGYRNSGDSNSGNLNSGDRNSGDSNSGNLNSGDRNSGYRNSGYSNSGNRNSGNLNSGDSNSGYSNSGYSNSGDRNSGDSNSGNLNSGDRNSGNLNSGDRNSGDSNSGYRNSGAFCTDNNPMVWLFDLPTKITVRDWEKHKAVELMNAIDTTLWIPESAMSEQEKKDHPKWETTEGYLKTIPMKEAWANAWHNFTDANQKVFLTLPNFDAKKFEQITGIKIKNAKATKTK